MTDRDSGSSFGRWLSQPEALIALAAVLLSLCGVFIALFEASVLRREARASVWPHVEVAVSLRSDAIDVRVRNTGVGPALVRAAAVTYGETTLAGWGDLYRSVVGPTERLGVYFSLIGGRVLPPDSTPETILGVSTEDRGVTTEAVRTLQNEIEAGNIDVELCYCSVYDQCWTTTLQSLVARSQRREVPASAVEVEGCDEMEVSVI